MRERRFLVSSLAGPRVAVAGDERHHAVNVLRLVVGAEVTLFDGKGNEAPARVADISPDRLMFELSGPPIAACGREFELTIAVAAPKGARGDWLVEKCAEFGVSRLIFIESQRGEVQPGAGKIDRWQRKIVEAAKQSGAARLTEIESGATLQQLCDSLTADVNSFFGTTGDDAHGFLACLARAKDCAAALSRVLCFIGPEGGWTDAEESLLRDHGVIPVSLGTTTLRIETAAIAVAANWAAYVATVRASG